MSNKLNVFVCSFHEGAEFYTDPSVKDRITINKIFAEKLSNDFVCVSIDWNSDCDSKYADEGPTSFGYADCSKTVQFQRIKYSYKNLESYLKFPAYIEVGLELLDESGELSTTEQISYTYLFMERSRYGVCVYFAPKDWANGQREVLLDVTDPKF
jgi:hypothetical protein